MESASWQRPLYGFEISQNQAKMSLKSGFSDGLGGKFNQNILFIRHTVMRLRLRGRFIILLFPAVRRDDARRESIPFCRMEY